MDQSYIPYTIPDTQEILRNLEGMLYVVKKQADGKFVYLLAKGKLTEKKEFLQHMANKTVDEVVPKSMLPTLIKHYHTAFMGHKITFSTEIDNETFVTTLRPKEGSTDSIIIGTVFMETKDAPDDVTSGLLDYALDAVVVLDASSLKIHSANHKACKLLGQSLDELTVSYLMDYFPSDMRDTYTSFFEDFQSEEFEGELTIFNKGEQMLITYRLTPFEKVGLYAVTFRDLNETEALRQKLEKAESMQLIGELAAGIAHEIKNPIASLQGFLKLLQPTVKKEQAHYIEIMNEELKSLEQFSTELLELGKQKNILKRHIHPQSMLDMAISLMRGQAREKNVRLKTKLEAADIMTYGDEKQLKQVFINLIKNAIEATPEGENVSIYSTFDQNNFSVFINDEGEGMSEHTIKNLGQPFYTTKTAGSGLGLMVVFNIVKTHGGTIKITSDQGIGTQISLTFPIE
ncbi:PAS domain-containing sensor histidine kinase [Aureibacillus halotolerans]|uniref:histidine kinase n=1 Tax=Aureibacillus halotolerans TaxID=1508390 RepID=A0A4R6U1W4_9BACI|nr:PAS domain-containing sensor histidine kinase [Aureibacillus halotolerans]TDQ40320.1 PAS domain S-box-containing protein [Aureibacillus halotolerans]